MQPEPLILTAVHAHPDDEVFGAGGAFVRAAHQGMRTVLVCCTGSEEGDISVPAPNPEVDIFAGLQPA